MTKQTEALKMAIEALESFEIVYGDTDLLMPHNFYKTLNTCKEALEQPAQEPVAFRHKTTGEFCTGGFELKHLDQWTPLYTHPYALARTAPSCQECKNLKHDLEGYMEANKALINREWVGLIDDEILILCAKMAAKLPNKKIDLIFARAIEQASKEKNT